MNRRPVVSLDDNCPNGEGSRRRYFCGDETGERIGENLLLLGEAWFIKGSKSRVLFRVAPQAIALAPKSQTGQHEARLFPLCGETLLLALATRLLSAVAIPRCVKMPLSRLSRLSVNRWH